MKKLLPILTIFLSLLLISCRTRAEYNYLCPTDKIVEIAIVDLSFDSGDTLVETVVCKIDDLDSFIEDFQDLDCYVYWGDPASVTPTGVSDRVIKFVYANGSYELVNWNGQSTFTPGQGLQYYSGFRIFSEEAFEALIKKHSP